MAKNKKLPAGDPPPDVVRAMAISMISPVGGELMKKYNKAVKEYPEWFPEETEHIKKINREQQIWDGIPESKKEYARWLLKSFLKKYEADHPAPIHDKGKGLFYNVHSKEYHAYLDWTRELGKASDPEKRKIFNQVFVPYGLEPCPYYDFPLFFTTDIVWPVEHKGF